MGMGGEGVDDHEANDANEIGTNDTNAHRGEFITLRGCTQASRCEFIAGVNLCATTQTQDGLSLNDDSSFEYRVRPPGDSSDM